MNPACERLVLYKIHYTDYFRKLSGTITDAEDAANNLGDEYSAKYWQELAEISRERLPAVKAILARVLTLMEKLNCNFDG